jgi:MYXO-CTERM domain-containing protein
MLPHRFLVTLLLAAAATGAARSALVISADNLVPYVTYASPPETMLAFGGTWVRNFVVQSPSQRQAPPDTGTITVSSFWDIWCEVSTDGGSSWDPVHDGAGSFEMSFTYLGQSGGVSNYASTVTVCSVNGLGAGDPVQLRLAAAPASSGSTTIQPVDTLFFMGSFFDIFLENFKPGTGTWEPVTAVSLNGGANWLPGPGALRLESIPEPSPWWLAGLALALAPARRKRTADA